MKPEPYASARYLPFGDNALVVEFGNTISPAVNLKVVALSESMEEAGIQGVEELVGTYRSLLVRYNPLMTTYEQLVSRIKEIEIKLKTTIVGREGKQVAFPVFYGGEYGPDLSYVAQYHRLTEEQVVRLHSEAEYRVYMIGFVAGFPYLGEVVDDIATPRHETPRLKVPAGSVGIAEKQTGIYPCEAPGGWQIIGRTPLRLFNPRQQPPTPVEPGDIVKFEPISEMEFKTIEKAKPQPSHREQGQIRTFRTLKPGFFTTVQDIGRYGYLKYGVPISGAMDTFSLVAANLLLGNDPNAACLEMTLIGPELQALRKTQIAVTGGDISPRINGGIVPMWLTVDVQKGSIVSFGRMENGCRAYLSVRGGIDAEVLLGSRSTYVRGEFGGIAGRQLKVGDLVHGFDTPSLQEAYSMPEELVPKLTNHFTARVVLGPQTEMFSERGVDTFFSNPYKITLEADRMGYRLEGPAIEHKAETDIVSDALLPGAIQVPRSGRPILMMRDAQTTGGYSKIAVTLTSDVNRLGQAKPGNTVEFLEITMRQAQEEVREFYGLLDALGGALRKRTREP